MGASGERGRAGLLLSMAVGCAWSSLRAALGLLRKRSKRERESRLGDVIEGVGGTEQSAGYW